MLPDNCQHQGGLEYDRDLSNWCILSVSKLIVHHRMACVAEDLKDYLAPTPLPWLWLEEESCAGLPWASRLLHELGTPQPCNKAILHAPHNFTGCCPLPSM